MGGILRTFARGEDATPVKPYDAARNEVDVYKRQYTTPFCCERRAAAYAPRPHACSLMWIVSNSLGVAFAPAGSGRQALPTP